MYKDYVNSILNCRKLDADTGSNGGGDNGGDDGKGEDGDPEKGSGEKTFTQDDVNNLISKTKLEIKEKNKTAIQEAVENALKEERAKQSKADEFNKLSDKKKQEVLDQQREKELSDREAAVQRSEFTIEVKSNLQKQNLSPEFADMVIPNDLDAEKTTENIATLKKLIDAEIQTGIETGLATYQAKDTGNGSGSNDIGTVYGKKANANDNKIPEGTWG